LRSTKAGTLQVRLLPWHKLEEKKGEDASKYLDGMFNLIENRMHHTAHTNATASLKIATIVATLEEPWR
jgi:flagellin-specific chaperone FliS